MGRQKLPPAKALRAGPGSTDPRAPHAGPAVASLQLRKKASRARARDAWGRWRIPFLVGWGRGRCERPRPLSFSTCPSGQIQGGGVAARHPPLDGLRRRRLILRRKGTPKSSTLTVAMPKWDCSGLRSLAPPVRRRDAPRGRAPAATSSAPLPWCWGPE